MSSDTLVQIAIYLQIFFMGILVTVAARHAYAHFRPGRHQPETIKRPPVKEYLPPVVKERLLKASQEQFQSVVKDSAHKLQHDLESSSEQINKLIKKFATDIVEMEMERYRVELARLRNQANTELGGIRAEVAGHETELKAKITSELEAEKQRLIKQIDTKLADAVGSFLSETLAHNVDLGSQSAYLIAMLEEHKADFIKGVADETQPTK